MIKGVFAALIGLTLSVPQVHAAEFTEADLLTFFESQGGRVYVDSTKCTETRAMGIQQGPVIHICTKAHKGDVEEMKDTIRHEMWHVVQACNGGPITPDPIGMITTARIESEWSGAGYASDVWHMEAEATYIADKYTAADIAQGLTNFCK